MTRLAKLILFASSLAPLLLLLAVRYLEDLPWAVALAVTGVTVGLLGLALVERLARGQPDDFVVDALESRAEATGGYLTGYLFPFLVLVPGDTLSVAATIGFLALLAFVYTEGNLVYLNPVLLMRGWHVWVGSLHRADDESDRRTLTLLIKRASLREGQTVRTHPLAGSVRLATLVTDG